MINPSEIKARSMIPSHWTCVSNGFSREDVKANLVNQGISLSIYHVLDLKTLCFKILKLNEKKHFVSNTLQLEILKLAFQNKTLKDLLPELKKRSKKKGFFKKWGSALSQVRLLYSHETEKQVFLEQLESRFGVNAIHLEFKILNEFYNQYLESLELFDLSRLLERATEECTKGWPSHLPLPTQVEILTLSQPEGKESLFWETLSQYTKIEMPYLDLSKKTTGLNSDLVQTHTVFDAIEYLCDWIEESEVPISEHAVIIPNDDSIRRALYHQLGMRKIPIENALDPKKIMSSVGVKNSILVFDVITSQFEREKVVSYVLSQNEPAAFDWITRIYDLGVRKGLESYKDSHLEKLYAHLKEIYLCFKNQVELKDLANFHLSRLKKTDEILYSFFCKFWEQWSFDLKKVGLEQSSQKLNFWLPRIKERLSQYYDFNPSSTPCEGVKVYRDNQISVSKYKKIWFLGLQPFSFNMSQYGNVFISAYEKEHLSKEYSNVLSPTQIYESNTRALKYWLEKCDDMTFLQPQYSWDGKVNEDIANQFFELYGMEFSSKKSLEVHPRFDSFYENTQVLHSQKVSLPHRKTSDRISATFIDDYSRCSFLALARQVWKLEDVKEPTRSLPFWLKGQILHECVQHMMGDFKENLKFTLSPGEVLKKVWEKTNFKGVFRSAELDEHLKAQLLRVLVRFQSEEEKNQSKKRFKIHSLEVPIETKINDVTVKGRMDRVDECDEGLFIIDYKTTSSLPTGQKILEKKYRLQLPLYAIAAQSKWSKPVVGLQFIELNMSAKRSKGIYFNKWNGKSEGALTEFRSNNKSLLGEGIEPDGVWSEFDESLKYLISQYQSGEFSAEPKVPEVDCLNCGIKNVCGFKPSQQDAE